MVEGSFHVLNCYPSRSGDRPRQMRKAGAPFWPENVRRPSLPRITAKEDLVCLGVLIFSKMNTSPGLWTKDGCQ